MPPAVVRILHPEPAADAGELTRILGTARALIAEDLARRFAAAGATDVDIVRGRPDREPFGTRVRALAHTLPMSSGLVVLGSGSIPLATDAELAALVAVAGSGDRRAATNNRFSADVVAIGSSGVLRDVPDLGGDNALPRWLEDVAGVPVDELGDRDRLALDLDSPLDIELLRRHPACPPAVVRLAADERPRLRRAADALTGLAALAASPGAELLIAGRLSAATLRTLETRAACRVRALVEERGLRTAIPAQRAPASVLGLVLDGAGPAAIGQVVGRLADGALLDTRVLLAHRLGGEESGWPAPEDRYASDLLLSGLIRDPWLRDLTAAAADGDLDSGARPSVPIALGGHTLVGPGAALALELAG